jgi:hypothetical protein
MAMASPVVSNALPNAVSSSAQPAMVSTSTPTSAPAPVPSSAPAAAPAVPVAAPSPAATTPVYQSETGTPVTGRGTSVGNLPSSQESMLKDMANLALSYTTQLGPGQVTAQQQQVLDAWKNNASSDYGQFMANQGMSMAASNPGALFNEESATAQSQWSMQDAQSSMSMLGLSAKDWDDYQKLKEQAEKDQDGLIMGAVMMVAGAAITYFSGGALATVGVGMMASGAKDIGSS